MSIRFHFTRHGVVRESERQLSQESIKSVVRAPDTKTKLRPGTHKGVLYAFEKTVEGATLKVVAEVRDSECWIVTAYEKD